MTWHTIKIVRNIRSGLENLLLHKLRSFLTMLGVVFGVGSVVAGLAGGGMVMCSARGGRPLAAAGGWPVRGSRGAIVVPDAPGWGRCDEPAAGATNRRARPIDPPPSLGGFLPPRDVRGRQAATRAAKGGVRRAAAVATRRTPDSGAAVSPAIQIRCWTDVTHSVGGSTVIDRSSRPSSTMTARSTIFVVGDGWNSTSSVQSSLTRYVPVP